MIEKKRLDVNTALSRAAGLCSRSEQCEYDIRDKLKKWNVETSSHDQIISWLYEHRFLDTQRYANAYCTDKYRFNRWGVMKIRMMLRSKRIPDANIEAAIEAIDYEEYNNILTEIVAYSIKGVNMNDYSERVKLTRRIVGRGFTPEFVIETIKRLRESD